MLVMLGMLPTLRKTSPRKKPALVKNKSYHGGILVEVCSLNAEFVDVAPAR